MLSMMELGAGLANEWTNMDAAYICVKGIAYMLLSAVSASSGAGATTTSPKERTYNWRGVAVGAASFCHPLCETL